MDREIERLQAQSDDGEYEVTLVVYQDIVHIGSTTDPHAVIPGMKTVRTVDGLDCNVRGDDTFEIVNDAMIVHRVRQVQ